MAYYKSNKRNPRKHNASETETPNPPKKAQAQNGKEAKSTQADEPYILATGLEDYGRWKTMFENHKRDPNEKPFRRGRIWA